MPLNRKPKKESWNKRLQAELNEQSPTHPDGPHLHSKAVQGRREPSRGQAARKSLQDAYKRFYEQIPAKVECAACKALRRKENCERHHPAGRRKAAFLFTFMLCPPCHKRVHDEPAWAQEQGLLWKGRNSKEFTADDARSLVSSTKGNTEYALKIYNQ